MIEEEFDMELAIIGLGKMGLSLAELALENGIQVFGLTKSEKDVDSRIQMTESFKELVQSMKPPRKIFLYVPAGKVVEEYVKEAAQDLSPGDVLIDGGNSYWGDSLRRASILKEKNIFFIDLGTSGGISGARKGACFMAGGEKEAYALIEPLLKKLSTDEAFAYIGPSGSGHLVKLIHNGIEFGMLQAIGEGIALLEKFKPKMEIDMASTFRVYRHGSVIRSWLIDLMAQEYKEKGGMKVPSHIEDTGEVNWLLSDALHVEVPIPVIAQSLMELFRSRDEKRNDYQAIAMMRHGFGGHPFGEDEEIRKERSTSRLDESFQL